MKTSLCACLFLLAQVGVSRDFTPKTHHQRAYTSAWELEKPVPLSRSATDPLSIYIHSLHKALHIILNEDASALDAYEEVFDQLEEILESKDDDAETLFVRSEILLHHAFVQLKFRHEISAAWLIRKSHKLMKEGRENYPSFTPLLKTSGVHNIILGAIPKKYEWLISLFGLSGNISDGIAQLNELTNARSFFQNESLALLKLVGVYLSIRDTTPTALELPENSLSHLISALVYSKTGKNQMALSDLTKLESLQRKYPVIGYLTAEAKLRASQYLNSMTAYQRFIKDSKGTTNNKDAYFKIAIIHHLTYNSDSSGYYLQQAEKAGAENSEADKHAARVIRKDRLPHPLILKVRLSTDGGYYKKAQNLVESADTAELIHFDDQLEFEYRKARLYHKQDYLRKAINTYQSVVKKSPSKGYYYGANSCLQLGLIFERIKDYEKARHYLLKVSSYTKHEYKSSLDQKAKTALSNLPSLLSNDL